MVLCMGRSGVRVIIVQPLPSTQKSNGHSVSVMFELIMFVRDSPIMFGDAVCLKDTCNGATVSYNVLKLGKNWGTPTNRQWLSQSCCRPWGHLMP